MRTKVEIAGASVERTQAGASLRIGFVRVEASGDVGELGSALAQLVAVVRGRELQELAPVVQLEVPALPAKRKRRRA